MYYRYLPYPYYRRYYNLDPYYYRRYYNPYYNYQQNIIDSQIAGIDQSIINYGDMTDVNQDANIFQSMAQPVGLCTSPMAESVGLCTSPMAESVGLCTCLIIEPGSEPLPEESGTAPAIPFPL